MSLQSIKSEPQDEKILTAINQILPLSKLELMNKIKHLENYKDISQYNKFFLNIHKLVYNAKQTNPNIDAKEILKLKHLKKISDTILEQKPITFLKYTIDKTVQGVDNTISHENIPLPNDPRPHTIQDTYLATFFQVPIKEILQRKTKRDTTDTFNIHTSMTNQGQFINIDKDKSIKECYHKPELNKQPIKEVSTLVEKQPELKIKTHVDLTESKPLVPQGKTKSKGSRSSNLMFNPLLYQNQNRKKQEEEFKEFIDDINK
jgi:hypothetical protein